MLKILQARLQQYWEESPDVQVSFRKGRGTRDQVANICWIIRESKGIPEKTSICFTDCATSFDCVDHNKLWKILQEMGIPDHLTCLLRKFVCRSRSNSQNWTYNNGLVQNWQRSKTRLYIVTLLVYLTYMQSTSWEMPGWMNHQAGIKIAGRSINNLRYADDITLTA